MEVINFPKWFDRCGEFPPDIHAKLREELLKINPDFSGTDLTIKNLYTAGFVYAKYWTKEQENRKKYKYSHKEAANQLSKIRNLADELRSTLSNINPYISELIKETDVYGYTERNGQEKAFALWDELGTRSALDTLKQCLLELSIGLTEHPRTKGLLRIAEATGRGSQNPEGAKDFETHEFINLVAGRLYLDVLEYKRVPEVSEIQPIVTIMIFGKTNEIFKFNTIQQWVMAKKKYR